MTNLKPIYMYTIPEFNGRTFVTTFADLMQYEAGRDYVAENCEPSEIGNYYCLVLNGTPYYHIYQHEGKYYAEVFNVGYSVEPQHRDFLWLQIDSDVEDGDNVAHIMQHLNIDMAMFDFDTEMYENITRLY